MLENLMRQYWSEEAGWITEFDVPQQASDFIRSSMGPIATAIEISEMIRQQQSES
jgi:hypothetical protein